MLEISQPFMIRHAQQHGFNGWTPDFPHGFHGERHCVTLRVTDSFTCWILVGRLHDIGGSGQLMLRSSSAVSDGVTQPCTWGLNIGVLCGE